MNASSRTSHLITATVTAVALAGGAALVWTVADRPPAPSIADATESMVAGDSASFRGYGGGMPAGFAEWEAECGPVMEQVWGPSEEDLARQAEENAALMAALDEAGVAYELIEEENGWAYVEPVGESDEDWRAFDEVLNSVYEQREADDLAEHDEEEWRRQQAEENAEITAAFEEAGIEYEVFEEEDGWVHIEPVSDEGYQLMEQLWRERERRQLEEQAIDRGLDPVEVLDCADRERRIWELQDQLYVFPFPMDTTMAERHTQMVNELMAAFDEAGVAYERVDVPIVSWDLEDEAAQAILQRLADEHGYGGDDMAYESEMVAVEPAESTDGTTSSDG